MRAPVVDRRSQGWAELATRPLGPSHGWGPAWRLARRDLARHRARTAAAAVMVLVPVLLASALATVLATLSVSSSEDTLARMGAADVLVQPDEVAPSQDPWTDADIAAAVGAPVLPVAQGWGATVARGDARPVLASPLVTDYADPRADGIVEVLGGRLPSTDTEIAVSPGLADTLGAAPGDTVTVDEVERTVSGVAVRRWTDPTEATLFALPGAVEVPTGSPSTYWLADPPDEAILPNSPSGLVAVTRGQLTSLGERFGGLTTIGGTSLIIVTVGITLIVLEIALLAGPAFAVGVRQQQQTLALLAATGGDARALRRVVLAQALFVGVGASLVGAAAGVSIAVAALSAARYRVPVRIGPLEVRWEYVLLFVAIGVVAAVGSALVPALTASRSTVVGALAVRPTSRRLPWRRPLAGLALMTGGTVMVWAATENRLDAAVLSSFGILALGIGMVLVVPLPVALLAQVTTRLPLGVRLAGRESSRAAARSVAAVAAVAGASASLVAALTLTASFTAEQRVSYSPQSLPGVTTVRPFGGAELAAVRQDVADLLPDARVGVVGATDGSLGPLAGHESSFTYSELFLPTPDCPEPGPGPCVPAWSDWPEGEEFSRTAVTVLDTEAAVLGGYDLSEQQLQVLADGGVLVANWSPAAIEDETIEVTATTFTSDYETGEETVSDSSATVPAARYSPAAGQAALLVGEGAARALDVWNPVELLVQPTPEAVDTSDPDARAAALAAAAPLRAAFALSSAQPVDVYTEVGFRDRLAPVDVAVVVAALVVLLGATFTATALALADARRDRAVLTAIGASPRDQRLTAGATAALIAGTGALVGALVGLVPGVLVGDTVLRSGTLSSGPGLVEAYPEGIGVLDVVPWGWIAVFVLGLPVFAGLVVAAVSRGRPESEAARMSARPG